MQNIDLICLGKLNAKYYAEGVAEYTKRLSALRISASSSCRRKRSRRKMLLPPWWPGPGKGGQGHPVQCPQRGHPGGLVRGGQADFQRGAGRPAGPKGGQRRGRSGLCDRLLPRPVRPSQAGRRGPDQPGADHPALHQLARLVMTEQLYRACTHQRRHEVPQIKSKKRAPASPTRERQGRAVLQGQDGLEGDLLLQPAAQLRDGYPDLLHGVAVTDG